MRTDIASLINGPIASLRSAYATFDVTPREVITDIIDRAAPLAENNLWICAPDMRYIDPYLDALESSPKEDKPLWGIPFAVKDNIDVAGFPTTAACPAFSYLPETSAWVVQQFINAGAIPVGKTNLDQFATGLVGTRSPYGICTNPQHSDYISGGSSSGSAVAVANGLAVFALGTDTAGSGRIPAAFNGLVGLKPSRGLLSTSGVVPACRSIDCVSLFSNNMADAALLFGIGASFDAGDGYARPNPFTNQAQHFGHWPEPLTLGVLPEEALKFFDNQDFQSAYASSLDRLQTAGVELVTLDWTPFAAAAAELYQGPWVAERYLAAEQLLVEQPDALLEVTRGIISPGKDFAATDLLRSTYKLATYRQAALTELSRCDALLTPTAGTRYSVQALSEDPLVPNSNLGYYTNFMNLLDFCGVAFPGVTTETGQPFGLTLVADRDRDVALLSMAEQLSGTMTDRSSTADTHILTETIDLMVCGAHMSGLPLNWQLTQRGGKHIRTCATKPSYKMYALPGGPPYRPGLVKSQSGGAAIDVEVWRLPAANFASFVQGIPAPLGVGTVELEAGEQVTGFICETDGLEHATDITHFGGWRGYLAAQQ